MSRHDLDLADIQGNILRAYGRYGFPFARYYILGIKSGRAAEGRAFVDRVRPRVTSAVRWNTGPNANAADAVPAPDSTLNIAFTFYGLLALGLPTPTLARMPPEFIDGMAARSYILGDEGPNAPEHWDPIWRKGATPRADDEGNGKIAAVDDTGEIHIWISINARDPDHLGAAHDWLMGAIAEHAIGVQLLTGHGPDNAPYQDASALFQRDAEGNPVPSPKEHFGFTDGIGNPVFSGQYEPQAEARLVLGRGKLMPDQTWAPLATGEFLLGHADESQELPPVAPPWELTRNGSYMVFRKLHENVKSYLGYISGQSRLYARVMGMDPDDETHLEIARETMMAKMAGRWTDGIPLMAAGSYEEWQQLRREWDDIPALQATRARTPEQQARLDTYRRMLIDFTYGDDKDGTKCPYGAHIRRANTRDMLDPMLTSPDPSERTGSSLNKRRRILRRGLPYGASDPDNPTDDGEHGIIFIAVCASLGRQFEFVQQQWMQYGLDFNVGNDTCPLIGNHDGKTKFVITADPQGDKPPVICANMPQFVTTRGGDYFFIPGLNGLRMIAEGSVDPT
ncbi:MAG: peroxidase [Pseudomonadota bacterium]|nr:peroxidase [Pseudomonadota bacterium]